jgi:hypothetical protein
MLTDQHQRLKEMKQLTKDTGGQLKPKASQGSSEIQSMSLSASTSGAPKKKPVFKAIGSSSKAAVAGTPASLAGALDVNNPSTAREENDPSGAVRNGYDCVTSCCFAGSGLANLRLLQVVR